MTPLNIVAFISIFLFIAITVVGLFLLITKMSRPVTTDTGKTVMVLIDGEWHVCGCGVLVRNNLTDEHIRLTHHQEKVER